MPKQRPSRSSESDARKRQEQSGTGFMRAASERQGRRAAKRPRSFLRAGLAVFAGRAAGALSRRLGLGGGTSIAGLVAGRIYPDIVSHLSSQLEQGAILVTGTNGKTTTSGFIGAILSDAGLRVWRNREGANLVRGVAGALVIRARFNGRLRRAGQAISIFEVDEAVMPQLVQAIPPRVAVFTNLFRDQLDRYGEVDSVAARWQHAVSLLPTSSTLVLNADDPTTANLGESFAGRVIYFGIDDPPVDLTATSSPERHQVIDTRTCPHCGGEYSYSVRFYSHLGHYACPQCGHTRPEPDVRAIRVQADSFDRLRMQVVMPMRQGEIIIPLPGFYNVYNALAAIAAAQALAVGWEPLVSGIEQFKPAFGRGERVQAAGRTIRLLLAKNPTGFNEVLRTLFSDLNDSTKQHILLILNDNTADGRDISWIWDVDFERMVGRTAVLTLAGTRALDLALRLKYAGVEQQEMTIVTQAPLPAAKNSSTGARLSRHDKKVGTLKRIPTIQQGIAQALDIALSRTPVGETLFVVPTYTGLLEIHRELERRGLTPHYWEERGP